MVLLQINIMGLFGKSNPTKKLEKKYKKMLEEARDLQRSGDIPAYALKMEEAEKIAKEIETLKQ